MRAVAAETGISATAIYRHFADKGELLAAMATRGYHDLLSALRQPDISTAELISTSNNMMQISFEGRGRVEYAVDRTMDFVTWTPVGTSVSTTGGVVTVTDPASTNYSKAYYRIRLE